MKRSFLVPALALLFAGQAVWAQPPATLPPAPAAPGHAEPAPVPPPPGCDGPGPLGLPPDGATDGEHVWVSAEGLLWWLRGMHVPPLVTASPAGTARDQAATLSGDGTTVLYGGGRVNGDDHFGGRFSVGYVNPDASWPIGFEGNFFSLATTATHFAAPSDPNVIVGRPFFDPSAGRQDALLVNFPGAISGTTAVNTTQFLLGAEALVRENVYLSPSLRVDALAGYRFLNLREQLHVADNFTSTDPAGTLPVGTAVRVADAFETINYFNGAEVGLAAAWASGPLSLEAVAKLAVGGDNHRLVINGFTTTTTPGGTPTDAPGGLLAQPTNSGRSNGTDWSLVPEGAINLRWDVNSHVRLTAGYTFLWWDSVVRPGDQIDTVINRTGLSGGTLTGEQRPVLNTTTSGVWVQGIQLGLTYSF
jgi:hypothetical protein